MDASANRVEEVSQVYKATLDVLRSTFAKSIYLFHRIIRDSSAPTDIKELMPYLYGKAIDAYHRGSRSDGHAIIFKSLVGIYAQIGYDMMEEVSTMNEFGYCALTIWCRTSVVVKMRIQTVETPSVD